MVDVRLKGVNIGRIEGSTYYTDRKQKHFFIKYHGFAISEEVLDFLERKHVEVVNIIYRGVRGMDVFRTPLHRFKKRGHVYWFKDDKQFVLNTKNMVKL